MSRASHGFRRSVLISPHLGASVAVGLFLVALAAFDVPAFPLSLVAAGLALGGGLVAALDDRSRSRTDPTEPPALSPALAADGELARLDQVLRAALTAVAGHPAGPLRESIRQRLITLGVQFRAVASGAGVTGGVESWYVAHDAVLAGPDLHEYRVAVRVRTADCAADSADQESLHAAFAAVRRGVLVERVLVLPDPLWPAGRPLPADDILPWVEEQHAHGIRVILIRERELPVELESAVDTCVFGDWAVGRRDLDDRARTARVSLDFTPATVRAALDRMDRLSHLGISFRDLLDRDERAG